MDEIVKSFSITIGSYWTRRKVTQLARKNLEKIAWNPLLNPPKIDRDCMKNDRKTSETTLATSCIFHWQLLIWRSYYLGTWLVSSQMGLQWNKEDLKGTKSYNELDTPGTGKVFIVAASIPEAIEELPEEQEEERERDGAYLIMQGPADHYRQQRWRHHQRKRNRKPGVPRGQSHGTFLFRDSPTSSYRAMSYLQGTFAV